MKPHTQNVMISLILIFLCNNLNINAQSDSVANLPQYLLPNFTKGIVKLKTGTTYTVIMNYNTVTEKMAFYQNSNLLNLSKPETVDTIFLQNMKFIFNQNAFFEVLVNAPVTFFIQHRSTLTSAGKPAAYGASSETSSSTAISKLYNDKTYNLKLPDNFTVTSTPVYWVRMNNVMQKFTSERQFLKIFPKQEIELKKFIKNSNINIKNREDLIKLATYFNTLVR